jgi:hypothetical protein
MCVRAPDGFPTGLLRVIYSATDVPAEVGHDEVKDQVSEGVADFVSGGVADFRKED